VRVLVNLVVCHARFYRLARHVAELARREMAGGGGIPRTMKRLLNHTFEQAISLENLLLAWQEFAVEKRYKPDVARFSLKLFENIRALQADLRDGIYQHGGYYRFSICDPKPRVIHKATVRDRLLHHALYRVLYPFFEPGFSSDVYSSLKNKGAHAALYRFSHLYNRVSRNSTRTCWVLKCDIAKFFDSIDHAVLKRLLRVRIEDAKLLVLLDAVIASFSVTPGKGLPLGNLTSQLFCNIYLGHFDAFVKHAVRAKEYIRYADDFVVLSDRRAYLESLIPQFADFLQKELTLQLHPRKVSISTVASGVDFLGWVHFPHHRVLRTKTRSRLLRHAANSPMQATIQSYRGLLKHGHSKQIEQQLASVELFGRL
jgi:RNA-directed DNA polymerase